jgi:hypothetical protein
MKPMKTFQVGIIGSLVGFVSLFGLHAVSVVQAKTGLSILADLAGAFFFAALYFLALQFGTILGQNWRLILMSSFIYGVFGGMLGQAMASLFNTGESAPAWEFAAALLCGLLISLLFSAANRHVALVILLTVIALLFVVTGLQMDFTAVLMPAMISVGVWLLSPLVPKLLPALKNDAPAGKEK